MEGSQTPFPQVSRLMRVEQLEVHPTTCSDCAPLCLRARYCPIDFVEGDPRSPIWIVALNPASAEPDRSTEILRDWLIAPGASGKPRKVEVSYFRDLRRVSQVIYERLGERDGVAHTDLVKCPSPRWDSLNATATDKRLTAEQVIQNCGEYLKAQLLQFRPQVVICNGAPVSRFFVEWLTPGSVDPASRKPVATLFEAEVDGWAPTVVLSGFVRQMDNHARARLGREIDQVLARRKLDFRKSGAPAR